MDYDAIVVGGGMPASRRRWPSHGSDSRRSLVTQRLDTIGALSCNPAIEGSPRNIVREIDALGGEMAHLIDRSMIQFRILNRRRGPAVQAPRACADKFTYNRLAKETVEGQANLALFMDTVVDLLLDEEGSRCLGIITERGHTISSRVLVLTTGTFMEGKIFIGEWETSAGRLGEAAAIGLGTALRGKGFPVGRMKTGTPARVRRSSIDFSKMERQEGDEAMLPFSFDYPTVDRPSLDCYITWTGEETHRIIRANMDRSPLYGGKISGIGPRYCPSIEDKVVRFPERERHQIFIEPEGLGSEEMYLNGISSSLPEDVQTSFIHSIAGLEEAEIMRPAYAVEYDYADPMALTSLESKLVWSSSVTSMAQRLRGGRLPGLMAGINAAQKLKGKNR